MYNSRREGTAALGVRFPDAVFIRTSTHFGQAHNVKIFHKSAAKPSSNNCAGWKLSSEKDV